MPAVFINESADGAQLDYAKKITVRWDSDPQGKVKNWKFYLGTEDGRWDLLMCELGNVRHIELEPHELPLGGKLFAQIRGVYDGKDRDDQDIEERVFSKTIQWSCPDMAHAPDCCKKSIDMNDGRILRRGG